MLEKSFQECKSSPPFPPIPSSVGEILPDLLVRRYIILVLNSNSTVNGLRDGPMTLLYILLLRLLICARFAGGKMSSSGAPPRNTVSCSLPPTPGSDPLDGGEGDGADNPEEEEGEGEEEHVAPERSEHLVGVHRRLGPLRTHPLRVQHG